MVPTSLAIRYDTPVGASAVTRRQRRFRRDGGVGFGGRHCQLCQEPPTRPAGGRQGPAPGIRAVRGRSAVSDRCIANGCVHVRNGAGNSVRSDVRSHARSDVRGDVWARVWSDVRESCPKSCPERCQGPCPKRCPGSSPGGAAGNDRNGTSEARRVRQLSSC